MYPWLAELFNQLGDRYAQARLHHALLLKGVTGVGKDQFAKDLAIRLLCQKAKGADPCGQCQACLLNQAESHPDYHQIVSDKQIGVDLIRGAIEKLTGTAQLGGAKVLLIHAADSMTDAAANALLKTLEEPTANTYLLLLCKQTERLLPTILSRCEKITLHPPNSQDCAAWVQAQSGKTISTSFARLYNNAPLAVLAALEQESGLTHLAFLQGLAALQRGQSGAVELATKWQENASEVISWLQHQLLAQLRTGSNLEPLFALQSACLSANQAIRNPGINKMLLLSGLLQPLSGQALFNIKETQFAG